MTTEIHDRPTIIGMLLRNAERGRLPDSVIRLGIRRLLKHRLRDLQTRPIDVETFLQSTFDQPVAVMCDSANDQHYEVPAQFFRKVLGPNLKYSCCFWRDGVSDLETAERDALEITCQNAQLFDGMKILELGCGWGSLSLFMAERYPNSQITSVSNSSSQRAFIQQKAAERGLDNLTVLTADMNDFSTSERFDRVVSVEMFEHMRNHRALTNRIRDWLHPEGRLFVHIFCHQKSAYLFETDGEQNWMGRHFFTGGMMPSVDLLPRACESMKLLQQHSWNGQHYAKTCRAWLNRQDINAKSLKPVLAETYGAEYAIRWHNRWRLFFMACEELFAFGGGKEWFVSHYLFQK